MPLIKLELRDKQNEGGFTLIELLVVSGLLAVLAGILYGTTSGILRGRAIVEQQRQNGQIAQYVLERMARELTGRYLIPLANQDELRAGQQGSAGGGLGSGYASAAGRPALYFLGVTDKNGKADNDRVRFVSANAAQASYGKMPNFGLVEVEYRLEKPNDTSFSQRPEDGIEVYTLVREEFPAGVSSTELIDERKFLTPQANNVVALNLRYFKEGNWEEDWSQGRIQLPEAIEITLQLKAAEGQVDLFRTAVAISRAKKQR